MTFLTSAGLYDFLSALSTTLKVKRLPMKKILYGLCLAGILCALAAMGCRSGGQGGCGASSGKRVGGARLRSHRIVARLPG